MSVADLSEEIQTSAAPTLEVFVLHHTNFMFSTNVPVVDLFEDFAPKLRSLDLERVALRNWQSSLLSGLSTLSIAYLPIQGPSLHRLTAILKACPALSRLALKWIEFGGSSHQAQDAAVLPCLESMEISDIDNGHFVPLLCLINAPNCVHYDFGVD